MKKTSQQLINDIITTYSTDNSHRTALRLELEHLVAVANREGFFEAIEKVQKM